MTPPDVWEALAKIRNVRLRCWSSSDGSRHSASITLYGEFSRRNLTSASFTARQRSGETIEAMVWRAIVELQRRELEGNPKPSAREIERRKRSKLLAKADTSRPM